MRAPFQVLVIPFRRGPAGYEFAVLKRRDGDYWQFVAGGGEAGEAPMEAARRETREELGVTADLVRLDSVATLPKACFEAGASWGSDVYVIPEHSFAVDVSDYAVRLSAEHTSVRWVSYEEASRLLRWDSNRNALWELRARLEAGSVGGEMDFRFDTVCGLYCGACDVLRANRDGTVDKIAHAWGMDAGKLRCHGCKSAVHAVYCSDCDIKICADKRGVSYCFECAEYPCARLVDFRQDDRPHHSVVLENLVFIREQGLERWLAAQRTRWSCPSCGAEFGWYDKTCSGCGNSLYDCRQEERDIAAREGGPSRT